MKEQRLRDLGDGSRVDSVFALRSRDIRSARTGETYLSLEMGDSSGRMPAVMFRPSPVEESLPVGSAVRVRGTVTSYRGVRRISVDSLRPVAGFDPRDLLPAGARDREEMLAELRALVRRIHDRRLRGVVRAVFGAPGFIDVFAACPATSSGHHAYVGGLLEHTISVSALCASLAASYPQADADLLLAAALLHDVGRVRELGRGPVFRQTDEGRLLGHVHLGLRLIEERAESLDAVARAELLHAVACHHDLRAARTAEAAVLYHANQLDAVAATRPVPDAAG